MRLRALSSMLLALTFAAGAGADDQQKSESRLSLEQIARSELERAKLTLAKDAEPVFREGLQTAEAEVKRSPEWRDAAESGIKSFMGTVVGVAQEQSTTVVTLGILNEAQRRRCPVYPWCRRKP